MLNTQQKKIQMRYVQYLPLDMVAMKWRVYIFSDVSPDKQNASDLTLSRASVEISTVFHTVLKICNHLNINANISHSVFTKLNELIHIF